MYYARGVVSEDPTDNRDPLDSANRLVVNKQYLPADNGFCLVPNVALIYNPAKNQSIKLLYGEATKQPSFTENYRQILQNRPDLQQSKIQTIEINYYSLWAKKLVINSSAFYSYLSNLINSTNVYNAETSEWEIYSTNSGELYTKGLEISAKYYPLQQLTISASTTYQQTKSDKPGYENIDVAYSPNFLANGHIVLQAIAGLLINASFRYVGSMHTEWVSNAAPADGNRLANKTNPYFICDLNIRQENLFRKKIFISLKINNILNANYRYPVTTSNKWIDLGVPGEKIKFYLQSGVKF
jgi:outer membrane receptor for ferrienterochelin and colicin